MPLHSYRARYYNPNIGRFISEDRVRSKFVRNFYPYVLNSPIKTIDPSGMIAVTPQGCCKDRDIMIQDAANQTCKNKDNDGQCKQMLNKYGLKKCFDDKCKGTLVVKCGLPKGTECGEPESSGGSGGGAVVLYPLAFSGFPRTTGCGNLQGIIAHEIGHLCGIGPDHGPPTTDVIDNYYKAINTQYACDNDPSTIPW